MTNNIKKPLNVLIIDDRICSERLPRAMTSKGVNITEEFYERTKNEFYEKIKATDFYGPSDYPYKKFLEYVGLERLSLSNFEENYKTIKERGADLISEVNEDQRDRVFELHKTLCEEMERIYSDINVNLEALVCEPSFTAKNVIKRLKEQDYGKGYDLILLDLQFSASQDHKKHWWMSHGGVVVGKVLQKQGRKFSFFTGDQSHSEPELKKACEVGLISKEDLDDCCKRMEIARIEQDSRYPVYSNTKGNVLFGDKKELLCLLPMFEKFQKDKPSGKVFNRENLRKIFESAKRYQLGV